MPEFITGLDHVQIEAPAGCEAAARAFSGGVLGLMEVHKPVVLRVRGGAWFALPDGRHLHVGVVADFVPRVKGHPRACVRMTASDKGRLMLPFSQLLDDIHSLRSVNSKQHC